MNLSKLPCLLCELLALPLLLAKAFYNSHSGQNILKITVQVIKFQPLSVKNGMNMMPEHSGNHHYHQHKYQREQCHLHADGEHHHQCHNHGKQGREHVPEYLFHKFPNLSGISGDAVHQFTRSSVVDKRQGQYLNLVIQLLTKAHTDGCSQLYTTPISIKSKAKANNQQGKCNCNKNYQFLHRTVSRGQSMIHEILLNHWVQKVNPGSQYHHNGNHQKLPHEFSAESQKLFQHIRFAVTIRTFTGTGKGTITLLTVLFIFSADDPVPVLYGAVLLHGSDDILGTSCHICHPCNLSHGKTCRSGFAAILSKNRDNTTVNLVLTFHLFTILQIKG